MKLCVGVRRKPAAAVHRHAVARRAEQIEQRNAEQPRLEVPQGTVHGGNRARADTGPPEVAHLPEHRGVSARDVEDIAPFDDLRQHARDHLPGSGIRISVAQAGATARRDLYQHERRRFPVEGAITLRRVRWDRVAGNRDLFDLGAVGGSARHFLCGRKFSTRSPTAPLMMPTVLASRSVDVAKFLACVNEMCGGRLGTSGSV